MGVSGGPDIIQDGLVLSLDASDRNSYVSGSTIWRDLSSSQNNNTLTNGPTFNSTNGGSIAFDGTDDFSSFSSNITFSITQPWSYSIWLSPASGMVGAWKNIIAQNADTNCTWMFHPNALGFYQSFYNSATYIWYTSIKPGTTLPIDIFSNIVITCSPVDADRTFFTAYLNGVITDTTTFTWSPINRNQVFNRIGGNGARYYIGNIANTFIYNKVISAQEVLQNYNAQKSRFNL